MRVRFIKMNLYLREGAMSIQKKIHNIAVDLRYVRSARVPGRKAILPPALIDTSLGSQNAGDSIIMYFATKQLSQIWDVQSLPRIPSHEMEYSFENVKPGQLKIVCGTNALHSRLDRYRSVMLPDNPSLYKNSVNLLAVGMSGVEGNKHIDRTTGKILHSILSSEYLHSVRDSRTEQELKRIGIDNVVNTSCVTMWNLTQSFCQQIPTSKNREVLTTITDYSFNPIYDQLMLDKLNKHYKKIFIWVQGSHDAECMKKLDLHNAELVWGGFNGLVDFINEHHKTVDYVGTRLHCGIFCLNNGIRSVIVSVDNRAKDIAKDTNLPVIERVDLPERLDEIIEGSWNTEIRIPEDNIKKWKTQFEK